MTTMFSYNIITEDITLHMHHVIYILNQRVFWLFLPSKKIENNRRDKKNNTSFEKNNRQYFGEYKNRIIGGIEISISLSWPTAGCMGCLLYTSPSPRDATLSRMPSSA